MMDTLVVTIGEFVAEHYITLIPIVLVWIARTYAIDLGPNPKKEWSETGPIRKVDWFNFILVAIVPFVAEASLYLTTDVVIWSVLQAIVQFYMFITHLSWSIGFGQPGYLNFPYVDGLTIGKSFMTIAIGADLISFFIFVDYTRHMNIPLNGNLADLIWWNVFSHICEWILIREDPVRFYVYVFGPDEKKLPLIVAWLKWLEGWIDSIGHLVSFLIAAIYLDSTLTGVAIFFPTLLFMATLQAWDSKNLPAYLGLAPPGLNSR